MRDVSRKATSLRKAVAHACIKVSPQTISAIKDGNCPKGDPYSVAKVAGIMGAKEASRIIPFCHPVRIDSCEINFETFDTYIRVSCTVSGVDRTGMEMEALCGAAISALTIYDMLKVIDEGMVITEIRLLEKRGGKHDFIEHFEEPLKGAVVVISDSAAQGKRMDKSGRIIEERLRENGVECIEKILVPDDLDQIETALRRLVSQGIDLVITTGGTGLGPRDCTKEATVKVIEKDVPGIAEAIRAFGQARTPRACLSRGVTGVAGKTLIINLPGSSRGVEESLDAIMPGVLHIFPMMKGGGH